MYFYKKRLQHMCFLVCEHCEVFDNRFFTEHLRWLLLKAAIPHDQKSVIWRFSRHSQITN